MEQEQLANPARLPLIDEMVDSLKEFDAWSARLTAEGKAEQDADFTKAEAYEEISEAQDQLKADVALIEREEEKLRMLKDLEGDGDFESMREQAAKLTEGALTKGTVDTYKR